MEWNKWQTYAWLIGILVVGWFIGAFILHPTYHNDEKIISAINDSTSTLSSKLEQNNNGVNGKLDDLGLKVDGLNVPISNINTAMIDVNSTSNKINTKLDNISVKAEQINTYVNNYQIFVVFYIFVAVLLITLAVPLSLKIFDVQLKAGITLKGHYLVIAFVLGIIVTLIGFYFHLI